jgi:hypothetical protein
MTFNRVESVPNDVQKRGKMGHFELRWEKLRWIYTLFNNLRLLAGSWKSLIFAATNLETYAKEKRRVGLSS